MVPLSQFQILTQLGHLFEPAGALHLCALLFGSGWRTLWSLDESAAHKQQRVFSPPDFTLRRCDLASCTQLAHKLDALLLIASAVTLTSKLWASFGQLSSPTLHPSGATECAQRARARHGKITACQSSEEPPRCVGRPNGRHEAASGGPRLDRRFVHERARFVRP